MPQKHDLNDERCKQWLAEEIESCLAVRDASASAGISATGLLGWLLAASALSAQRQSEILNRLTTFDVRLRARCLELELNRASGGRR